MNAARPLSVPPTEADIVKLLTGRSSLHANIEHALFVVADGDGREVACCAAMINRRYQQFHQEAAGFIGYFAASDDAGGRTIHVLDAAEHWLAERAVTRVIAGYNGHLLAGLALRSAEFESSPVFPLPWHPALYTDVLETAGYRPTYPWWSYRIDFSSDVYKQASTRALRDAQCQIRPVNKKRWDADIDLAMHIYNESFRDEWEYHPFAVDEAREYFAPLKPIFDPRLLLLAEVDGEPAGFCLGLPDWSPHVRTMRGKSNMFAQLRFARSARRYQDGGLYAIGVLERHRGKHIGQTLASALYRRYEALGLKGAEYHVVNDANLASRTLATTLGGKGRILYHNFDKALA
ncbi:MAG TPA: GNAT family N-acetyltransferase [Mycobacteriales bacterium]|nr:GNAT family N-acetyltransferase [Mycobacteriales bacterium]